MRDGKTIAALHGRMEPGIDVFQNFIEHFLAIRLEGDNQILGCSTRHLEAEGPDFAKQTFIFFRSHERGGLKHAFLLG